ncbi:protein chromatin remodeling 19 [Tanacetum coccineum]
MPTKNSKIFNCNFHQGQEETVARIFMTDAGSIKVCFISTALLLHMLISDRLKIEGILEPPLHIYRRHMRFYVTSIEVCSEDGLRDNENQEFLHSSHAKDEKQARWLYNHEKEENVVRQVLHLTGANTIIMHDMDFNPHIDRAAKDCCHRIGQTTPDAVYRCVYGSFSKLLLACRLLPI